MLDPVSIANIPADGEPLTEEDRTALAAARESSRRGDLIPHEQVLRELGITQEEIDNREAYR